MDPEPYLRLPPRRVSRRSARRPRRWLPALGLCVALVVVAGAAVIVPRLGPRLVPLRPAPVGSGWEQLGFREREILLVRAHWREPVLYCVTAGSLARSPDAGETWEEVPLPAGAARPGALAVGTHDPDLLLLGTEAGQVYRSEDGGLSWKPVAVGGGGRVELAAFDPQRPRVALLVTSGRDGGLWHSSDYGRTWTRLAPGPLVTAGFHPRDGEILYIAGPARIGRTADGGRTWTHRDLAGVRVLVTCSGEPSAIHLVLADRLLSLPAWGAAAETVSLPGEAVNLLAHPADSSLLYLGTVTGVWRSDDRGVTWTLYSEGLGSPAVTGLSLGLEGRTLYVGTVAGGLWRYSPAGPGEGMLP